MRWFYWYMVALLLWAPCGMARGDEPPGGDAVKQEKPAAVIVTDKGPLDQDYDGWITELIGSRYQFADFDATLLSANGLGVDVATPDAVLRAQLGLEEGTGLVLTGVPPESAGAKAGLAIHDLIIEIGERKVADAAKLKEQLDAAAGKAVKLRVLRGGKPLVVEVPLPKVQVAQIDWTPNHWKVTLKSAERYRLGVTLAEADGTLRAQLRLAAGEGLVVTEVVADSAAAAAGIQAHDVLIVLDGKRLTTVEAINAQVQEIKDRQVELRLLRSGKEMSFRLAPRKTQEAAFVDRPVTFWDTKSCQRCHAQPFDDAQAAHLLMGSKLGAHQSAWIDSQGKAFLFGKVIDTDAAPADAAQPKQQIESLKAQLAQMQQTLAALESSLASATPPADKKPTNTPADSEGKDREVKDGKKK
jgi:predicted metalloprotease with PDZ domain